MVRVATGSGEASGLALVLVPWDGDSGIWFEKDAYERLKALDAALQQCLTWRSFRQAVGDEEFFGLSLWVEHGGEQVYEETPGRYLGLGNTSFEEFAESSGGEYEELVIRPDDAFSGESVPEFSDGATRPGCPVRRKGYYR